MKYFLSLLISTIVVCSSAFAYQPKLEIIEQFDNLKVVAFISPEDIENNPQWNPDSDALPLTVDGAIEALKSFTDEPVSIEEIEIRTLPKHDKQWHYLIKVANDVMESRHSIYVVLMNGTVIPAIIEPQSLK